MSLLNYILPETILFVAAAILFIMGASKRPSVRIASPVVALFGLVGASISLMLKNQQGTDWTGTIHLTTFALYIKGISIAIAGLFVLLAWPSANDGASNRSIHFSTETGEYFALLLLAVAGMCVVSSANTLPTLFLGVELASIPTYIMVTMSRPQEQAQEAGIKYFFLGAAAAGIMVFGMSYLFGLTGEMQLDKIMNAIHTAQKTPAHTTLLTLAVVLTIGNFLFKMAAVPLHFYAGDVYQGAATPVTAAISFIPKITGVVALLKILFVAGGGTYDFDPKLIKLLWIVAVLTMTVGNMLGLLQYNVKRVLAYSSIAHSGYLLVGVATVATATSAVARHEALAGIAFYMLAYGIMNTAAFGVLMLLPPRVRQPATTAETYDDIAGAARRYPMLGLAMTVGCLSLIGIPATIGFFGKLYLVKPAIQSGQTMLVVLAVITMINAAISAGYYLKIIATIWSRPDNTEELPTDVPERSLPITAAVIISVAGTLILGIGIPLAGNMFHNTMQAVTSLLAQ